jgi:hypothetical protein
MSAVTSLIGSPTEPVPEVTKGAQAAAKLKQLGADKDWSAKVLAGHGPQVKELNDLIAAKSEGGDLIAKIIDGTAETPLIDTHHGGETIHNQKIAAADLRERGHSDAVIRQVLESRGVSDAEFDAAVARRSDLMANQEWVKLLFGGDREARRELDALSIIIASRRQ